MTNHDCWQCGTTFATWQELFDHKENHCTEIHWNNDAEHW